MVTPGGSAPALVDQGVMVWAQVLDVEDQPVPNFPSQDIWLDDSGDLSLGLCKGGSHADANTDADGITTISGAVFAGGFTPGGTQVWIAGTPVSGDALPLIRGLQARHTRRTGNQRASPRLRARTITARIRVIDMRMNPVRRGNSPYSPIGVPHRN